MVEFNDYADEREVGWLVRREDGNVIVSVVDDDDDGDVTIYTLTPEAAVMLGATLFDKAQQEEDDVE